ncbi:MAG: hypothetical protein GEU97_10755 [Actinophytocola sp.]|nr:hypothetical protein [Actinophytocola sp.]
MGGSLEVREFLMRYDGAEAGRGPGDVPSQRSGGAETSRVSEDQVRRARIAVASGAFGTQDCEQLLDMLGLIPDDEGVPPVQR